MPANRVMPRFPGYALRRSLLAGTALVSVAAGAGMATAVEPASQALPTGGRVSAGQAAIAQAGGALTVTQGSGKAVLDWQSFDIGAQASVTFRQPDAQSVALNRVAAGDASRIEGTLSANGQVILINPSGVVFGPGAAVNAGGLVASTLDLGTQDFLAGRMAFARSGSGGSVVNHGTITAAPGGYAALLGSTVGNDGLIEARLGTVALASGNAAVLSFAGNSLVGVTLQPSTVASLIAAGGIIRAGGGKVLVSASAANALLGGSINADGVIEADSLTGSGGKISLVASGPITLTGARLTAGGPGGGGTIAIGDAATAAVTVDQASRLDVSATGQGDGGRVTVDSQATAFHGQAAARGGGQGGDGGTVETSGSRLDIAGALVDVGSALGRVGTWLLDPLDFIIDGSNTGAIQDGLANGDVTIQTAAGGNSLGGATAGNGANPGTAGDILVAAPLSWSSNHSLTLDSYRGVQFSAPVSASGAAAGVVIRTNDGGSGGSLLTAGGALTLAGSASLSINGQAFTLISTAQQLQALPSTGHFALAQDIDLGAIASFQPIGSPFNGTLEGLGHAVTGLSITGGGYRLGLFGWIGGGGAVQDLTLSGAVGAADNSAYIGLLAGQNDGAIFNVGANGRLSAGDNVYGVGGLVGYSTGTISQSWAGGSIIAGTGAQAIGGLVGDMSSPAWILGGRASVALSAGNGASYIGGLVGFNEDDGSPIQQSSASGPVTVGDNAFYVGGLVGMEDASPLVRNYAAGPVSAGNQAYGIGGLAGYSYGAISASYATGAVSTGAAAACVGGLAGVGYSISASYSSGLVTAGSGFTEVGGFVGELFSAPAPAGGIAASFWDSAASGQAIGVGLNRAKAIVTLSAVSGAAAYAQSTYAAAGWSFAATPGGSGDWVILDGYTRPMLATEYSTSISTPHQLQLVGLAPSADYRLAGNLDMGVTGQASEVWNPATGFVPIGFSGGGNGAPVAFTGSFDGQGHGIANLSVNLSQAGNLGLFSLIGSGGTVRNLGVAGQVTGGGGVENIGLLAGQNQGGIAGVFTAGAVSGGDGASVLGGLVGSNNGVISQSYATASVSGGSGARTLGGLTGFNGGGGTIAQSYAVGLVSAGSGGDRAGGLVGANAGTVSSSYWDITLSGQGGSAGGTGLAAAADWLTSGPAADAAWTGSAAWTFLSGHPYPLLAALPYVTASVGSASRTYGDANPALSLSLGAASDGSGAGSTAGLGLSVQAARLSPVGSYEVGVTGAVAPGYQIDLLPGSLTVTPLPVVLSGSRIYDGGSSASASILGVTNAVPGDGSALTLSGAAGLAGAAVGKQAISDVGSLTLAGPGAGNYTLAGAAGGVSILPRILTWTVADSGATYGTPANPGAATLSGVVSGDAVSATVGLFDGNNAPVTLAATTPAGNYGERVTGLSGMAAGNYLPAPSGGGGTLTIAPLPVVLSGSRVYDGSAAAPASILGVTNLVPGDGSALTLSGTGSLAGAAVGAQAISGFGGLTLAGPGAGNYTLAGAAGSVTITPKLLTWSVADSGATYGTPASPGGATLTGVVPGDAVWGTVGVFDGNDAPLALSALTPVGSYGERLTGLAGAAAGNYLPAPSGGGGTLTIAPLPVVLSGRRVYDGGTAAPASILGITNAVAGDGSALVLGGSAGLAGAAVGAQTISGFGGLTLSGAGSGNYTLAGAAGSVAVTPKLLTWSVANSAATYGTTASPGAATLTGVVPGDAVSAIIGEVDGSNTPVALSTLTPAGRYTERVTGLSGAAAADYALAASGSGTLTIAPKALTWSVADAGFVYGTAASPGAATLNGVVPGDALSGTVAVLDGITPLSLSATTPVGRYDEWVSGLVGPAAGNYILAPSGNRPGSLTISAEPAGYLQTVSAGLSPAPGRLPPLPPAADPPVQTACIPGPAETDCVAVAPALARVMAPSGKVGTVIHYFESSVAAPPD